jgi:hypothetical protein
LVTAIQESVAMWWLPTSLPSFKTSLKKPMKRLD